MNKIRVSLVGASGYTGLELVKIFLRHPHVEISNLAVRSDVGRPFSELFPALKGRCDLICSTIDVSRIINESDVIFFGLPHKTSMDIIPKFLDSDCKIIDLSADYRLNNEETYKRAYGINHSDKGHLSEFVYGLPEFNREKIRQTNTVANPGCFPTGIELALMPVLQSGLIKTDSILVDSKTGISGGGKTPQPAFHFPESNENVAAYKVASHQHEPEIEQELSKMAGKSVDIVFVPHLVPMTRGIYNTIYTELTGHLVSGDLQELYLNHYKNEPFVRVMENGNVPETKHVVYTNYCDIGMAVSGNRLILMSAIDNLIKGASGQAVQNKNVMIGLDETLGLN
ncbi:MAG: N-acetyl-gamma-glutamyl-phosphate reductase [Candidatus Marinimicrobia bacterium]|nr:N-acetyl-gamma-glutamyl-phosphate reductase [Candidatus Neomarinimicrobiota bacterium]